MFFINVNTKLQVTRACDRIMKRAPGVVTITAVRTVKETNNKYFLFKKKKIYRNLIAW